MSAILSLAFVSAGVLEISEFTAPESVNHDDGSFTITFDLTYAGQVNAVPITFEASQFISSTEGSITASPITINPDQTKSITATVNFDSNQNGIIEGLIIATDTTIVQESFSVIINEEKELTIADTTLSTTDTTTTITIENTGNTNFINVELTFEDVTGITFTAVDDFNINAGESKDIEVEVEIDNDDLEIGTNTVEVTATAGDATATGILSLETTYCEAGEVGGMLKIDRIRFTNNGIGDKDEWYLTDEIEVEVKIENTDSNEDVDDIIVKWGLYDKETGDFIVEEEENEFNLNDDEDETLTFTFTLDPEDFDEEYSESDFVFYLKAYSDDKKSGEDMECTEEIEEDITVKRDDNFVIIDNLELTSDLVPCGDEVSGDFRLWNVGEEDEEDVFVIVTNELLEINERISVGDMDILEDVKRSFSFEIPEDANERSYVLTFKVYDEDEDVFENNDDDEAIFYKTFNIEGECKDSTSGNVIINAANSPETPEAVAGKQFIIKATITNPEETQGTYTVSVFGNSAWSTLASIDPQLVTLGAGESKEVSIILTIDPEATGDKEFTIKATSGDDSTEQKIALSVSGKEEPQFDAFSEHIRNNWFIYVIVLINIILIIAIILVIRSMVRPREVYG